MILIVSIFLVSLTSFILSLRYLGKLVFTKPLFYLGLETSVSAQKVERNFKKLLALIFCFASGLAFFTSTSYILKVLYVEL
jgi:hypothetical protein